MVNIWFAAASLMLLGLADIEVLRALNAALHGLLTGVRVAF